MTKLKASLLDSFPAVDEEALDELLAKEIEANTMKIIVLLPRIIRYSIFLRIHVE